jgi:hypothetical protein
MKKKGEAERITRRVRAACSAEIQARRPDAVSEGKDFPSIPRLCSSDFDTPPLRRLLRDARSEMRREAMRAELLKIAWGD